MFLFSKLKKKNSNRHRKQIKWDFFTYKDFNKKYLYRNLNTFMCNKLTSYTCKDIVENKFNKKMYSILSDFSNGWSTKPYIYGDYVGVVGTNNTYNSIYDQYTNLSNINHAYLFFMKANYLVNNIKFSNSKKIIATSDGTYAVIIKQSDANNMTYLKLPSGCYKFVCSDSSAYLGRNGNIFKNNIIWGSWGYKHSIKKHKINVRGIAMNPVDHPNGGRSKIKKPFKNKYNKIAKKNK